MKPSECGDIHNIHLDSSIDNSGIDSFVIDRRPRHISGRIVENALLSSCSVLIAIPVQNEQFFIADCLLALARQELAVSRYGVLLFLNNCTDDSLAVIRSLVPRLPMPVLTISATLPPKMANAGCARRLAMQCATYFASSGCILMTTDADGQVNRDWITNSLAAFDAGADAVVGCAELNSTDAERLPARLLEDDANECRYDQLLDKIGSSLDPDPADPWPRHTEHSGASIAVTLNAYLKVGGIPAVPVGEDRALIEALKRVDARIRHSPDVRVVVSGRIYGRAIGGMADTIRRRLVMSDEMLDEKLEPARIATRRAWMRGFLKAIWNGRESLSGAVALLSRLSRLPGGEIKAILLSSYFGEAWAQLEKRSPELLRSRVPLSDLPREMLTAQLILDAVGRHTTRVVSVAKDQVYSNDCVVAQ